MTMINELLNKGVLQYQAGTKLLGVDLNGDKVIQDNEVVPDTNNNGKQDLTEILDFIVNNVKQMPLIKIVQKTVLGSQERIERKDNTIEIYEHKLEECAAVIYKAEKAVWNQELQKKSQQASILGEQFKKLQAEVELLKKSGDAAAMKAKEKEMDDLGFELSKLGHHPLAGQHSYYLPLCGKTMIDDTSYVYRSNDYPDDYTSVTLAQHTTVTLPTGEKAVIEGISFDSDWNVTDVYLAENTAVTLPTGEQVLALGSEHICFNSAGGITHLTLAKNATVTLATGDKVIAKAKKVLALNDEGQITSIWLAKDAWVTLPSGNIVLADSNFYDLQGLRLNDAGRISAVSLRENAMVTLPTGDKAMASAIFFNNAGNITQVDLSKHCEILLAGKKITAYKGIMFDYDGKIINAW